MLEGSAPPTPWRGFDLPEAIWEAVEHEALRVNDRYLYEMIEGYAFCPFAKEGRRSGQTGRHVYRCRGGDGEGLLRLFDRIAAATEHAVTQVILPLVEVEAAAFSAFCHRLTEEGNARAPQATLACAPLHPGLPFSTSTAAAMVGLFRRAPDPTIQWVRLDGLEALYAGRSRGTVCPSPDEVERLLAGDVVPAPNLYDRVCETNERMARRLGIDRVVAMLDDIARDGRRGYRRIFLGAEAARALGSPG